MKFDELNNEELVFTYLLIKEGLDTFNSYINNQGIDYVADLPVGTVAIFREFSDEEVEQLLNSDKYKLFNSTVSKLKPIVDLIEFGNPDTYNKIETLLETRKTRDGDTSQEEDML